MSSPDDGPGRRRTRWWSPLLLVHAALVVVVLVGQHRGLGAPGASLAVSHALLVALTVMLTAPWLLVFWGAPTWALLAGNLVLHLGLLRAFGGPAAEPSGRPVVRRVRRSAQFGLSVLAGALTWGAWLAWDTTASYDVVTRQVESPYVTLQVLGCLITVGVVTAVLGARWWWAAVAGGVSVGFWLGWTTQAGVADDTGLYLVGAALLAMGLGAGTTFAAFVGRVLAAARSERAPI